SKPESVKDAIESVVSRHGADSKIDIIINNAGILCQESSIHDCSLDSWHEIIDVNLNGAFYVLKYGLNQLIKQQKQSGGGVIINTTSVAGIKPAMVPPYNCSKAALISLTKEA
ncbi:unnamed protein product, partial [Didymodactylos carnosus]